MNSVDFYGINTKAFMISTIIGIICILLAIFGLLLKYTISQKPMPNDSRSKFRMQQLKDVLIYNFGVKWPYLLLVILTIFILVLTFFYYMASRDEVDIVIDDKKATTLMILFYFFTAGFTIAMITLAMKVYLQFKTQENTGGFVDSNYIPNIDSKKKNLLILSAVAAGLVLLFIILGVVGYFLRHKTGSI